jgi:hypothetical protein
MSPEVRAAVELTADGTVGTLRFSCPELPRTGEFREV